MVGWLVGWLAGQSHPQHPQHFRCRAGLGLVWGSCRLGKGVICRMRLGGFKVDFGSVLAWLGLIYARCAAGLAVAFGLLA